MAAILVKLRLFRFLSYKRVAHMSYLLKLGGGGENRKPELY